MQRQHPFEHPSGGGDQGTPHSNDLLCSDPAEGALYPSCFHLDRSGLLNEMKLL